MWSLVKSVLAEGDHIGNSHTLMLITQQGLGKAQLSRGHDKTWVSKQFPDRWIKKVSGKPDTKKVLLARHQAAAQRLRGAAGLSPVAR